MKNKEGKGGIEIIPFNLASCNRGRTNNKKVNLNFIG